MSTLAASKKAAGVERCGLVRENCLSVQCTILPARLATMIPKSGGDVESRNHVPSRNTLECGGHATLVHVRGNLDGRNLSSCRKFASVAARQFSEPHSWYNIDISRSGIRSARLARLGTRFGGGSVPSRRSLATGDARSGRREWKSSAAPVSRTGSVVTPSHAWGCPNSETLVNRD